MINKYKSHLENLYKNKAKNYSKIIDSAFTVIDLEMQKNNFNNLNAFNQQIKTLQSQIKTSSSESKAQILAEIKNINSLKNQQEQQLDIIQQKILENKTVIASFGPDRNWESDYDPIYNRVVYRPFNNDISFVDWVIDLVRNNDPEIIHNFSTLIKTGSNNVYKSQFAKQQQLEFGTSRELFNIADDNALFNRLSLPAQRVLGNEPTLNKIRSYLKGGKSFKKIKKTKKNKYSRKYK